MTLFGAKHWLDYRPAPAKESCNEQCSFVKLIRIRQYRSTMVQRNDEVYQELCAIAATFGVFDCIPCTRALKQFLTERNISGVQIVLETGSQDPFGGRIYDDSVGELIATTGHHEGIILQIDGQDVVFDNIHPEGVSKAIWLANLYSPILDTGQTFKITENSF